MKKGLFITLALFGMFITLVACSSDDNDNPAPQHEDIVLTTGDTYLITDGGNWLSEEPLIASITGNTITAERVGVTRVYNESSSFNVTVNPRHDLYDDPCMQWGASPAAVNSFMRGYTIMTQTSDMTIYQGKGAADFYSYSFENGQLASTVVYVNAGVYGYALTDFLTERYVVIYVDEQEGVVGMVNIAEDMAVFLTFTMLGGEVYAMVVYMPYSYDGNQVNVKRILSSVPKGMSESMDTTPVEVVESVREYIQRFKK